MKPRQVVNELLRIQQRLQVVFIARRDEQLREELQRLTARMPQARVLGWVDNMQEWMTAADILVSRAGGCYGGGSSELRIAHGGFRRASR